MIWSKRETVSYSHHNSKAYSPTSSDTELSMNITLMLIAFSCARREICWKRNLALLMVLLFCHAYLIHCTFPFFVIYQIVSQLNAAFGIHFIVCYILSVFIHINRKPSCQICLCFFSLSLLVSFSLLVQQLCSFR